MEVSMAVLYIYLLRIEMKEEAALARHRPES